MDVYALAETTGYVIVGCLAAVASTIGVLIATRAQKQASSAVNAAATIDSAFHGQASLIENLEKALDRANIRIDQLEADRMRDHAEIKACHDQRDALAERVKILEASL